MVYELGVHTDDPHGAPDLTQRYIQSSNVFNTSLAKKFDSATKLGDQNIVLVTSQIKMLNLAALFESQVES